MVEQRDGRRRTRRAALAVSLGTLGLILSGCSLHTDNKWWNQTMNFGFPNGITPEGIAIREFWTITVITSLVVGFFVWGLIFWTMAFHRKRKNDDGEFPRQTAYNVPLELVYTAVPFVIISVLFYFTVITQNKVLDLRPEEEVGVKVDVTAFQWNWKFGYNKVDVAGVSIEDGTNEEAQRAAEEAGVLSEEQRMALGHDGEPAAGGPIHGRLAEDKSYLHFNNIETVGTSEEVPVLVLPTGTRVEFRLAAADVIHSFWIPEFIYKLDVMPHPGQNQQLSMFQIAEIEREGAFVGRCAEMCGAYHAMMNFELRAVSPEAFAEYIQFRQDNPTASNAEALASIGEEPYSTSTAPFKTGRSDTRDQNNIIENASAN
ncbi:cytochrome c oxidase subunit II [Dietzia sp. CW19]|uniref:aa3-type cytochrome oxidase subunit II n=1 Tax=Dietzia sp. CW19 TaxID=1630634 RepID=UPI0015FDC94E|nr:cytochrome c oxidase subunit II [Dietzia sp. CW19]MBB1050104.1 cytochrome c oxidase subunit II [Dietzia sp. CW19]